MIIQDNLLLNRAEPNGMGGIQFIYKINDYGVTAISRPQEEISNIHWEVDIVKFLALEPLQYEVCHTTDLAKKTLKFYNDKALNEFLGKTFKYFEELDLLEKMLPDNDKS